MIERCLMLHLTLNNNIQSIYKSSDDRHYNDGIDDCDDDDDACMTKYYIHSLFWKKKT